GENGVYIGIITLIDALELDEEAARAIAAGKLFEYTGEQFGFDPAGDAATRASAVKLWREWWHGNKDQIEKIAVAAFHGGEASQERRRASDLWRQGIESEALGRFDAAEHFYRNATKVDPTAMGPFVSFGILLYQQRSDFEGALTLFRRALGRDAGLGDEIIERLCYYHIGRIYQFGLDFDRSRTALLKAIHLDPNYSDAWYALGKNLYEEALLDSGDIEQRRKQLVEARDTFVNGIQALVRYRQGLVVVDRTNLPFDSALPFSARDHNRTLRQLRVRILEELGRFRGRISAISLVLGDTDRVIAEHKAARTEGSLNEELKRMLTAAKRLQRESEPPEGEPVPSGAVTGEGNPDNRN
ncbi:MAG: tetratricopeptide repeat protein, partial [Planctomycetota bacterium]